MSAPAKPKISFPLDRIPLVNAFTVNVAADHPDAGVNFNGYVLRRRVVSGTLGAYEFWNATTPAWQVGTVTNTVTAFAPNATLAISGPTWVSGTRYQIDVTLRDTAAAVSAFSDAIIIVPTAIGSFAVTQPSANFTASRPKIAWAYTPPAAGTKYLYWRVIVYEDATSSVYWDSGYRYDPDRISVIMEKDCRSTHNYYFQVTTVDENNLNVGSSIVGPYLCTLNLPSAPTVNFTPEPNNGTMLVEVISAFNLLSGNTADVLVVGSIGDWSDVKNADTTYDNTTANIGIASLRITAAGKSYGFLDTESTTFTAEDTLYATYSSEIVSMEP
jgi:hypothetical protein